MSYCNNCGNPLIDNSRFCTQCGADQNSANREVENVKAENLEVTKQEIMNNDSMGKKQDPTNMVVSTEGQFNTVTTHHPSSDHEPKKKAGKRALIAVIAAIVFVISSFCIIMYTPLTLGLRNSIQLTLQSPEKYLQSIEKQNMKRSINNLNDFYESYMNFYRSKEGTTVALDLGNRVVHTANLCEKPQDNSRKNTVLKLFMKK